MKNEVRYDMSDPVNQLRVSGTNRASSSFFSTTKVLGPTIPCLSSRGCLHLRGNRDSPSSELPTGPISCPLKVALVLPSNPESSLYLPTSIYDEYWRDACNRSKDTTSLLH